MEDFREEIRNMSTQDLMLILEDQKDLYSKEEIVVIEEELSKRPSKEALGVAAFKKKVRDKREERQTRQIAEQQKAEQKKQEAIAQKIERLRKNGCEGYYEYKMLDLRDDILGGIHMAKMEEVLNDYALDGWRVVSAYTNEVGHNSESVTMGGFTSGRNSTVDQHIFILERYVKISKE